MPSPSFLMGISGRALCSGSLGPSGPVLWARTVLDSAGASRKAPRAWHSAARGTVLKRETERKQHGKGQRMRYTFGQDCPWDQGARVTLKSTWLLLFCAEKPRNSTKMIKTSNLPASRAPKSRPDVAHALQARPPLPQAWVTSGSSSRARARLPDPHTVTRAHGLPENGFGE